MPSVADESAFACEEAEYDHSLDRGLSVSGEGREFFARGRATYLDDLLRQIGERPHAVLDFGCGSGGNSPILRDALGARELVGVDVSERLLESARRLHAAPGISFLASEELIPEGRFDLAFCNGVLHHIPPPDRPDVLRRLYASLRPGGVLALWENNPWSPAARYVMSRIPFDRHAVMVWPHALRRAVEQEGFSVLRTDYCFVFPRFLQALRVLEPWLVHLPLGAQYQLLARRPR